MTFLRIVRDAQVSRPILNLVRVRVFDGKHTAAAAKPPRTP
jgi:hypothetical protein